MRSLNIPVTEEDAAFADEMWGVSPFNWKRPSEIGKDLGRVDKIRSNATKTVDAKLEAGVSLGTIKGLSKKADILMDRHGGQYSRARSKK